MITSPPCWKNSAYSLSVEKLLGIEIPPRGQVLRVMLMELERLASHLVWLGTHILDLGAMTVFFYAFQQREKILDLKEMISGVRMMTSWIVPGGLRGDARTAGLPAPKIWWTVFLSLWMKSKTC